MQQQKSRFILSLCGILLTGFAMLGCSSLVYQPTKADYYDPKFFFLQPKDLWIDSSNQQRIHAWFFESKTPAKGTFVFFHGNAENLTSHFAMMSWLPFSGYNYVIFDYPGYGESPGAPSQENTIEAGKAVIRYTYGQLDHRPLVIYGHSLGGAIALRAIQELNGEVPLRAAVIDGSFNSYKKVARSILSKHWFTWIFQPLTYFAVSDEKAPGPLAELSPLPLVFLHGDHDQVIEQKFSEELYSEAKEPKRLWIVKDGWHGTSFNSENRVYRRRLTEFLENCIPEAPLSDERCK